MEENSKKIMFLLLGALIVALAAMLIIYFVQAPRPMEGSKAFTVTVVDDDGIEITYPARTDAEYLREALKEINKLEIHGTDGLYGVFVDSINGLTADFQEDGSYWAFYVNGEYGMLGIDKQPVHDGDSFRFVYER